MAGDQAEAQASLETIRDQAKRYLEARYGKNVWYRAPETFGNMVERWIWAVASSAETQTGENCIAGIERHMAELQG